MIVKILLTFNELLVRKTPDVVIFPFGFNCIVEPILVLEEIFISVFADILIVEFEDIDDVTIELNWNLIN